MQVLKLCNKRRVALPELSSLELGEFKQRPTASRDAMKVEG